MKKRKPRSNKRTGGTSAKNWKTGRNKKRGPEMRERGNVDPTGAKRQLIKEDNGPPKLKKQRQPLNEREKTVK